jgi:hypothetical protein
MHYQSNSERQTLKMPKALAKIKGGQSFYFVYLQHTIYFHPEHAPDAINQLELKKGIAPNN